MYKRIHASDREFSKCQGEFSTSVEGPGVFENSRRLQGSKTPKVPEKRTTWTPDLDSLDLLQVSITTPSGEVKTQECLVGPYLGRRCAWRVAGAVLVASGHSGRGRSRLRDLMGHELEVQYGIYIYILISI